MNFKDLLEKEGPIYLKKIHEPSENTLSITIAFTKTKEETESLKIMDQELTVNEILPDYNKTIQIFFPSYVSYLITNEGYCYMQGNEVYDGKLFKIHKHSRYLDYIKLQTSADFIFPDSTYVHYEIPCLNHIIDVVSFEIPEVIELS